MTRPVEGALATRGGRPGRPVRDRGPSPRDLGALRPPSEDELRQRYETYCRRQAAILLGLVPEGGAAALHRIASEREAADETDAFSRLTEYCRELLPLPPFRNWCHDFLAHPARYLDEARPWQAREDDGEAGLAVRSFDARGRRWNAYLVVRAHPDGWTGWLVFSPGESDALDSAPPAPSGCTGEIFREESAEGVVNRFVTFDDETLRAFLRSALP